MDVAEDTPDSARLQILALDGTEAKALFTAQVLGGMSVYASIAHTAAVLDQYFEVLAIVMGELARLDDSGLLTLLPGGVAQGGFARLT